MVDQVKTSMAIRPKLEAILFEFMEPLVVLLKRGKSFFVATGMPSEMGPVEEFLVVSVTPKFLKRYFREECDLRFLFVSAQNRRFFKMSIEEVANDKPKLVPYEGEVKDDWLPDAQFFASAHTAEYLPLNVGPLDKETVNIDGNWEMEDFGSFSRKLRDLYAFEDSLYKAANSSTPPKVHSKIKNAFTGKPFRGGSSYGNFFNDLVLAQSREDRFDLSRIKYASPGHIELVGKGSIFDAIEDKIENFVDNQGVLRTKYNEFHKYMSDAKLLEIQGDAIRINAEQRDKIEWYSRDLLSALKMDRYDLLFELSEKGVVSTAKISLALYRRVNAASAYFAQGRAIYPD